MGTIGYQAAAVKFVDQENLFFDYYSTKFVDGPEIMVMVSNQITHSPIIICAFAEFP